MSMLTGLVAMGLATGASYPATSSTKTAPICDAVHSQAPDYGNGWDYSDRRPNFLGTVALPIRANRFDESWQRAKIDASQSVAFQRLISPAIGLCKPSQIAYVQTAIHRAIQWRSDATQWGQHDYWASAWETLSKGAGDAEDLAILKMQALRSLGFNPNDLFITMGRDSVAGPVTLLIVRLDSGYYMLNDTGGAPSPLDARRREFQPLITLGWQGAFVHARTVPTGSSLAMAPTGRTRK